jgi:uncharacterized membrane protein YqjE
MMPRLAEDRSIGALFAELADETTSLVRKEIELARAELVQNASRIAGGAITLVVGGLVALLGVQALIACAILALALWVAPWLAALIVGAVILAIGAVMVLVGRRRLDLRSLTPRRTLLTLRRDREWAREQLHERL